MTHGHPTTRRPADLGLRIGRKPFAWPPYLLAVFAGAVACFLLALVIDWALNLYNVPIRLWLDAFYSAAAMMAFGPFALIGGWMIGVRRFREALLLTLVLLGPMTAVSATAIALLDGFVIEMPSEAAAGLSPQDIAFDAYVRIMRSALLVPPSLYVVFLVYYNWLDRAPRERRPAL